MSETNGIRQLASGRYQARYRFAPGARGTRTATFDKRGEAKAWLVTQESALRGGVGIDPRLSRTLLADWWADWSSHAGGRSPATREQYRRKWRTMLAPTFGHLRLCDVRATTVERWRDLMLERYAPRTVAHAQNLLSQILAAAVADRLLAANPAAGVAAPRIERRIVTAPEVDTVAALFDHAPAHFVVALHLGLGAGLRAGEVRGLTVDRIDFDRRLLTIDRQLLSHPPGHVFAVDEWHHGREAFAPPKGGRVGVVPFGRTLGGAIETHLRLRRPGPEGLVVTARDGGPMGRGSWDWEWQRLRKAAGVALEWGAAHQLRHAYASWLLADGESLANVSRNLRHGSPAFTLNMYVHPDEPVATREPTDRFARGTRVVRQLRASDQGK